MLRRQFMLAGAAVAVPGLAAAAEAAKTWLSVDVPSSFT